MTRGIMVSSFSCGSWLGKYCCGDDMAQGFSANGQNRSHGCISSTNSARRGAPRLVASDGEPGSQAKEHGLESDRRGRFQRRAEFTSGYRMVRMVVTIMCTSL